MSIEIRTKYNTGKLSRSSHLKIVNKSKVINTTNSNKVKSNIQNVAVVNRSNKVSEQIISSRIISKRPNSINNKFKGITRNSVINNSNKVSEQIISSRIISKRPNSINNKFKGITRNSVISNSSKVSKQDLVKLKVLKPRYINKDIKYNANLKNIKNTIAETLKGQEEDLTNEAVYSIRNTKNTIKTKVNNINQIKSKLSKKKKKHVNNEENYLKNKVGDLGAIINSKLQNNDSTKDVSFNSIYEVNKNIRNMREILRYNRKVVHNSIYYTKRARFKISKIKTKKYIKNYSKKSILKRSREKILFKRKFKLTNKVVKSNIFRKVKSILETDLKKIISIKFVPVVAVLLVFIFFIEQLSSCSIINAIPMINNPKEWVDAMNYIDDECSSKLKGDHINVQNENGTLQANWKNVISIVLAMYDNKVPDSKQKKQTIIKGTYKEIIGEVSRKYNVDPFLIQAIIKQESDFNPNCISSAGAMGLMQLMPENCREAGINNPFDPYQNIVGGAKQLQYLIKKYNGNLSLILAGYNAGIGNVQKYNGVPPFRETQNYIIKVKQYYNLYKGGLALPTGEINCIASQYDTGIFADLKKVYYLFNQIEEHTVYNQQTKKNETIVNFYQHDKDYVMKKLGLSDKQIQVANNMLSADLFSEIIKGFDFKFKVNIPTITIGALNNEEIKKLIENAPTTNVTREKIRNVALSLVGKVKYFWGGKSSSGWNTNWGKPMMVTAPGSPSTGTIRPYGLDCSGFVAWVYDTANITSVLQKGGTVHQWNCTYQIKNSELEIGDLVFNANCTHVGMFIGRKNGKNLYVHSSSKNGVVINSYSGFTVFRRLYIKFK